MKHYPQTQKEPVNFYHFFWAMSHRFPQRWTLELATAPQPRVPSWWWDGKETIFQPTNQCNRYMYIDVHARNWNGVIYGRKVAFQTYVLQGDSRRYIPYNRYFGKKTTTPYQNMMSCPSYNVPHSSAKILHHGYTNQLDVAICPRQSWILLVDEVLLWGLGGTKNNHERHMANLRCPHTSMIFRKHRDTVLLHTPPLWQEKMTHDSTKPKLSNRSRIGLVHGKNKQATSNRIQRPCSQYGLS